MPGGPVMDLLRDTKIKFPPNWEGELPKPATREELQTQLAKGLQQAKIPDAQIAESLDFLEQYESRYYEMIGEDVIYHRPCGGGAVVEGETGIFCAKCGRLPNLIPPAFLR